MTPLAASPNAASLPAGRFFRGSLFFLLLTSVGVLISTGKLDLFTCLIIPVAMLYKGFRWSHGKPAEISQKRATLLVVCYLGVFPIDVFFLSRSFVDTSANPALYAALLGAVHFLLFVMVVRLYSATSDRDALFLSMLAFAAILAAAVLTVDTSFLILFFVFLVFGVATFVGMEMRRGAKGALAPRLDAQPERDRQITRALSLAAVSVALGSMAIGSLIFLIFPRFNAGYLARASMQPSLMTGFTDSVELGQIGEIKKDSTVVMRVKTGNPVPDPKLRWRGIALSNFDGRRWTTPHHHAAALTPASDGWFYVSDPEQIPEDSGVSLPYEILLEPLGTDTVFVPADAISVRGNFSGDNAPAGPNGRRSYLFRDFTGSLFNPFRNFTQVRYYGYSRLPGNNAAKLRAAPSTYPESIRVMYLQLPTLDPRIPEFARQITARQLAAYDKASTMESYLRTRFSYTLNLTGKPGDDPLAHFLFETRAGHCEYFASAMTIMLRTLGIPAREVNGFLPGEFNDVAGDYIVRASDAHSWVEVYFPGNGWTAFDPTPAGPKDSFGLMSRFNQYVDWIQLTWNEWVVNYDFAHQVQMAQLMHRNTRNWTETARSWFAEKQTRGKLWVKSWLYRAGALSLALPVALVLFLAALRYDLLRSAFQRARLYWHLRATNSARANPQLASRLYAELLRLLERRGFARAASQTPFEFAAAVGEPNLTTALQEFTQIYTHARFGGAPCDTNRLRALLSQVSDASSSQRARQRNKK